MISSSLWELNLHNRNVVTTLEDSATYTDMSKISPLRFTYCELLPGMQDDWLVYEPWGEARTAPKKRSGHVGEDIHLGIQAPIAET